MSAQLAAFQTLAQVGQEMSAESLWPATLTFAGYADFSGSMHAAPATAELEAGFELSSPRMFKFLRANLPAGLVIKPKTSRFTSGGQEWRVVTFQDDPNQEQLRLVADLPARK